MKLTCREIRDLANALPFLGEFYFRTDRPEMAVAAVRAARKVKDLDEVIRGTVLTAMINAYGEFDPASNQRLVKSTSPAFGKYMSALNALLDEEHEIEIPFSVSVDDAGQLDRALVVDLVPLLEDK